jgi:hypothetical protein
MACAIVLGQNIKSQWRHLVEQHHQRLKKTITGEQHYLGAA